MILFGQMYDTTAMSDISTLLIPGFGLDGQWSSIDQSP